MLEVALVQLPAGGVVHERQADLGIGLAFPFQDGAHRLPQPGAINGDGLLRRSNGDTDHGCSIISGSCGAASAGGCGSRLTMLGRPRSSIATRADSTVVLSPRTSWARAR